MIKDLYDTRERKITNLALVKAKIENSVVDTSAMTKEEIEFFNALVELFTNNRKNIIKRIFNLQKPISIAIKTKDHEYEKDDEEYITVRILSSLPSFVGNDMNVYGPFKKEDIATLPKDIALALINKNRAERIDI